MNYDFDYQSDPNDYAYIDGDGNDGDDFEEYDDEYAYDRADVGGVSVDETIDCVISAWIDTLSQLYVVVVLCATFHVLSYVFNPDIWRSPKLYALQHILSALIGTVILYRVIEDLVFFVIGSVAVFYLLLFTSHHFCAFLYRRHERRNSANDTGKSGNSNNAKNAAQSSKADRAKSSRARSESGEETAEPDRAAFQLRCVSVIVGGLSFMLVLQCVVLDAARWTRLRGVLMIQLMKMASLADLVDAQNRMQVSPLPPVTNSLGYLLHCGTTLFGPFIPYSLYLHTLRRTVFMPRALTWWLHFLYALSTTAFSLTYSFCAVHLVFSCVGNLVGLEPSDSAFLAGFRDAQSFRFSHYFVSKFSELQLLLSGLTYDQNVATEADDRLALQHRHDTEQSARETRGTASDTRLRDHSNAVSQRPVLQGRQGGLARSDSSGNTHDKGVKRKRNRDAFDFEVLTANIAKVELPRSMIDIANNWNIPMHMWLRQFVFTPLRARFRMPIAVLGTYAVSSLLHGLNFQLSAVLLSIGLLSYVEFVFRKKFSEVFSACIHVKRCPDDCSRHRFKSGNVYVRLANFAFLLLNWLHLMFLGMMFDNDESQTEGYSMQHTLEKWYSVYFCSFVIAALMFLVNLIV